jgi:antitoxin PrlF
LVAIIYQIGITSEDNPAMEAFLDFLERDITTHPKKAIALDTNFAARIQALIADIEIDLDELLNENDD